MKVFFVISALIINLIFLNNIYAANDPKNPGDKIDDFTIYNIDGQKYSTTELKEYKALVIMFWSTECPFVQPYNHRIVDFVKEYQKKGFVFWGINSNGTEDSITVLEHAKSNNYPFPMLKDKNNVIADMLGATRTPEIFVISNEKIILYHGRIDDNRDEAKVTSTDLKNALDEIIAGKEITNKNTKSFGCSIKRVK